MEEILASIRRIIEDGDTAPAAGRQPVEVEPTPETRDVANDDGRPEAAPGEGGGPAAQIPAAPVEASPAEVPGQPSAPTTMADLQASLQRDQREPQSASLLDDVGEAASASDDTQSQEPLAQEAPTRPDIDDGNASSADLEPWQADMEAEGDDPSTAIISQKAGRQVAAAFEELSEAFAASRQRGFDEMAEEMLRPMLRQWMDDNLPVLVERLVREEIERVARGV